MSQLDTKTPYLVLSMEIAENTKLRREELELVLFDLTAEQEEAAVVTITTPTYAVERREAQWHEVEKAVKVITKNFPTFQNKS